MKVIVSSRLNLDFLPYVERKLVKKRIKELEECTVLGEIKYGRPHPLRGARSGMYGLRISRKSRLLLAPFECDEEEKAKGKHHWTYYITGVKIFYSPNHYKNFY